jgi:hypothetical protein
MVGAWVLGMHWPSQRVFFVPLLPLAIAALATLVLILRKVDVRSKAPAST